MFERLLQRRGHGTDRRRRIRRRAVAERDECAGVCGHGVARLSEIAALV
jgi:hypothetical protein